MTSTQRIYRKHVFLPRSGDSTKMFCEGYVQPQDCDRCVICGNSFTPLELTLQRVKECFFIPPSYIELLQSQIESGLGRFNPTPEIVECFRQNGLSFNTGKLYDKLTYTIPTCYESNTWESWVDNLNDALEEGEFTEQPDSILGFQDTITRWEAEMNPDYNTNKPHSCHVFSRNRGEFYVSGAEPDPYLTCVICDQKDVNIPISITVDEIAAECPELAEHCKAINAYYKDHRCLRPTREQKHLFLKHGYLWSPFIIDGEELTGKFQRKRRCFQYDSADDWKSGVERAIVNHNAMIYNYYNPVQLYNLVVGLDWAYNAMKKVDNLRQQEKNNKKVEQKVNAPVVPQPKTQPSVEYNQYLRSALLQLMCSGLYDIPQAKEVADQIWEMTGK